MAVIQFNKADVMRTKTLEAGWKSFEVAAVTGPKANKAGDGVNYAVSFRLIDDNNAELNGKEIERIFSNKAMSMMIPLAAACQGKKLSDINDAFELDLDTLVGKKIDGNVAVEEYQGNLKNVVEEYAPYKSTVGKSGGV
jgi:hypothetical protein